jgi:chemotaxis signal transduction protein
MVDLVKIRKKKAEKEKKEAAAPAEAAAAPVVEVPVPPPLPPPEPQASSPAPPPPPVQAAGEEAAALKSSKLDRFKAEAGQRREFQAAVEEVSEAGQIELLTFVIAGEQYAVDIERIVEIVTPRPVTRIPNADPSVVGIISLRGTIVTLVDVRGKLRHATVSADTEDTRIVVIDYHSETVGFTVDRVLRVVKATAGEIEPHPVVHATELDESVRGVIRSAGALTILLDLDKLLDHRALASTV